MIREGKTRLIFYAPVTLLCIITAPAAALTQITPAKLTTGTVTITAATGSCEIILG